MIAPPLRKLRAQPKCSAMTDPVPSRNDRRLKRQFDALSRTAPAARRPLASLQERRMWYLRLPLGLLLIAGGFLGFLPVLGFWMVPLGLLLIAIDVPALRAPVSSALVVARRRARIAMAPNGILGRIGAFLSRKP